MDFFGEPDQNGVTELSAAIVAGAVSGMAACRLRA